MASGFAACVVRWQQRHGRHDLPWQRSRDPYRIWVSEIMLQQTQVATVIPYYRRFLRQFPTVARLARAPLDAVLAAWSGLGYYSRARNLHRAAQMIRDRHGGRFPSAFDAIVQLPGIGRSTAAAICVFAYGTPGAILDGNVKRVLARCFGIPGYPGTQAVEARLWRLAERLLPERRVEAYTQGLMDLGSGVCTRRRPACPACPLRTWCVALREGRVERLPAPRPKAALPQRHTVMAVLERGGEVLLEKRPPSGIWGGMWSFPELGECGDALRACRARFGAGVRLLDELPTIDHGFTHFRLAIRPLRFAAPASREAAPGSRQAAPASRHAARAARDLPGCIWLTIDDALGAAIPTPVRRILEAL